MYDTFAIADMVSTVSMSSTASPEDINPNISTLHVTYQGPPGERRVIEDYREKSVLNGFSAAGGLGAFFSLLCAILFGTSLFSILFRAKPLSAFGILHGLESQQKELARVCKSKYPKLESELRALETEENRGVLALLLDTLLDLDSIKEQLTKPEFSVPCSNTEDGGDCDSSMEEDKLLEMHTPPEDFPNTARD
ncbi:hypothetical protein EST38_g6016 [Candolleomyces aberdarensis]|uniref:Uncharacterized protein n=1 Tax=Candolleomyces aberdarensis TaxID=2316362 RepID=A0A4V1Q3U8_9AGAR|nr:hypothetical protein EST38_g6016 [Candolleomyces aberdarensis]